MHSINFFWRITMAPLQGTLIYRHDEYSVDFIDYDCDAIRRQVGMQGCASLAIGTLQLELGLELKTLLYPWGYFPLTSYRILPLSIPNIIPGEIFVEADGMTRGVAAAVPNANSWKVTRDAVTGWYYIGDEEQPGDIHAVSFAKNVAAVIKNDALVALWINPVVI